MNGKPTMWVPLAYAIVLFLAASFFDVQGGFDVRRGVFGFGLALIPFLVWMSLRARQAAHTRFHAWLDENEHDVLNGGAEYDGETITAATTLVQYRATFSFAIFSVNVESPFAPLRPGLDGRDAFLYSLSSILFGPWAIPFGLISTIGTLRVNLSGGVRRAVFETIIDEYETVIDRAAIVEITDRAARAASMRMRERGFPSDSAIVLEIEGADEPLASDAKFEVKFDDRPEENSRYTLGQANGVRILVPRDAWHSLLGMTLDYDGERFQLIRPDNSRISSNDL